MRYIFFTFIILLSNISYANPLIKHHQIGECRPIIQKTLLEQFSPLKENNISKEQLDTVSKLPKDVLESLQLNRIQFIDGEFYGDINASWGGGWHWLTVIKEAHKKNPIKNFDAFIACGDSANTHIIDKYNDIARQVPIFHINKLIVPNSRDSNILLLPADYMMTGQLQKTYDELDQNPIAWEKRKKIIGWRGAPSDGRYRTSNIHNVKRLKLVLLSALFPDLIDAKFAKPSNLPAVLKDLHKLNLTTDQFMSPKDMLQYRYLASLDGKASTFTRIPWVMYSNSTMLFQTEWIQWFFPAMKPWVHYVPLKDDLSDTLERYHWLESHDDEARIIADNAKKFVTECIGKEESLDDLSLVLNEYASILKFDLKEPSFKKLQDNEFSIPLHTSSIYGKAKYHYWKLVRIIQNAF